MTPEPNPFDEHTRLWADEFASFDPDDPDGFQVGVYDDTPAPYDAALHEMIASGNELWRALRATPTPAAASEEGS